MKGFGLSSTGSTTLPRPSPGVAQGCYTPAPRTSWCSSLPGKLLTPSPGNVEHQFDEGFRLVEHRLDDTAPPKSRRSAGVLHPGTADELVLVPPRQTLNALPRERRASVR